VPKNPKDPQRIPGAVQGVVLLVPVTLSVMGIVVLIPVVPQLMEHFAYLLPDQSRAGSRRLVVHLGAAC
jgi:hypothetical protein